MCFYTAFQESARQIDVAAAQVLEMAAEMTD
jgi:hypothetical protein